ncbi:MAG: hypothetical protein ABSB37_17085, partial [Xanthobacteraceae bacterium]
SNLAGCSGSEPVKPRNRPPAWNGLRECWECRAGGHSAKANVGIEVLENIDVGLSVVGEGGIQEGMCSGAAVHATRFLRGHDRAACCQ